jgi:hypothetical protein
MQTKTKVGGAAGGLLGLMALAAAAVAFIVFLMAALAALVAVAAAVIAFVKRETWTKPAYRWARDKSGHWSRTPWSAHDDALNPNGAMRSGRAAN